jgi:hypothetical protein
LAAAWASPPQTAPVKPAELTGIALPRREKEGGGPLMQALAERKTIRTISEEKLSPQMLSNLL